MVSSSFDRIVADRTGCLNLMVWNDEAKFFIGKSAKELTNSQKGKEVKSLSDEIESIFEKKFLFKLSVSTQNVNSIDLLYVVDKICDDQRLIRIYSAEISSQITGMDHRVSDLLPNTTTVEADSEDMVLPLCLYPRILIRRAILGMLVEVLQKLQLRIPFLMLV
ncbi:hypothetical protein PIB30_025118 [Stylosanthes scabra]|uniref:Uncharacterized protein n=1 Tax=Stylosanthes scabra TaxID=79078 RepID=A0ABU6W8F6_9FABA|nr:hypothetical protein [Stylosanthes scabra]